MIKYDSPEEIVGSLYLAGKANHHLGDTFINAPVPHGLKAEELKQYQEGVRKVADPFFVKAKESYKGAVDKGLQLESYGKDFESARESLKKLDPSSIVDHGEVPAESKNSAWMVQL